MLLLIEKGIRAGICYLINRYTKANGKYMKKCDKNKELSYIMYLDTNNLYGQNMEIAESIINLACRLKNEIHDVSVFTIILRTDDKKLTKRGWK